jgi:hypothetical protein
VIVTLHFDGAFRKVLPMFILPVKSFKVKNLNPFPHVFGFSARTLYSAIRLSTYCPPSLFNSPFIITQVKRRGDAERRQIGEASLYSIPCFFSREEERGKGSRPWKSNSLFGPAKRLLPHAGKLPRIHEGK